MDAATHRGKVGIVGTGMVGSSFAYALEQAGLASELVLVDKDHGRAEGEAMDLNHGLPFVRPMSIRAGGYEDLAGADVVVITAGRNQRPGESRLDLVRCNAEIMREIAPAIARVNPGGVILMATNPVDVLTQVAADCAGLPAGRVMGSGTVLDTARFRYLIGQEFGVSPRSVHAYILGEHGDSQVPLWSQANIGGVGLERIETRLGGRLDDAARLRLSESTRTAAYDIIERKHATYYAIGLALLTIVEAVVRDLKAAQTVCSPMKGQMGMERLSTSLPTLVGRGGAEKVIVPPVSDAEREAMARSADVMRGQLEAVGAA